MRVLLGSAAAALLTLLTFETPAEAAAAKVLAMKPAAATSSQLHDVGYRRWRGRDYRYDEGFYSYYPHYRYYPRYSGYYGYPGDFYARRWRIPTAAWRSV